ncbi:MAG: hypothetical protein M1828_007232 [Chrysothrix sp. TS-e1954]|nr:MAG: hypothetical protein M1828_007232 [Chrysothrix sp. TS-e1954]
MHLELEQEQEAVVNRLQRELSALRAQTASVASNASSSSAATAGSNNVAVFDGTEPSSARTESLTGPTHPTPSRQHRSSSSLSSRSRSSTLTNPATPAIPIGSTSQASLDRARDATGISAPTATRSRGSSAVPPVQPFPWLSATASPSLAVASPQDFFTPTPSSAGPTSALTTQPSSRLHASPASAVSSARMEEASKAKEALQEANAEHESLVRKAKELERKLRGLSVHGESGDQERSRGRSEARATGDD